MITFRLFATSLIALLLAACGNGSDDNTPAPTLPPTLSPVLVDLQRDFEALSAAHDAISTVWENLATGQQAQCGEYPDVISPDSISADNDAAYETLAATLRSAAIDTDRAVKLWQAECNNPRQNPSPDVIDEGRLATRAAEDSLRAAEILLADIQVY